MKYFSVVVFCLVCILNIKAQQQHLPEVPAVKKVLQQQQDCWNKGDVFGFMQGYWQSDSLKFIGKSGISSGWNNTLKRYKETYPDKESMGTLEFEMISIEPLSDVSAYVVGKWKLTRSIGNIGGYFTLLFKKINNQWLIVVDHTS